MWNNLDLICSWPEFDSQQPINLNSNNLESLNLKTKEIRPLILTFVAKSSKIEENKEEEDKYETIYGFDSIKFISNAKFVECTLDNENYLGTFKSSSSGVKTSTQNYEILIQKPQNLEDASKVEKGFNSAFLALKQGENLTKKTDEGFEDEKKAKMRIEFKKEISLKILSFLPKGNWICPSLEFSGFNIRKILKKPKQSSDSSQSDAMILMLSSLASSFSLPKTEPKLEKNEETKQTLQNSQKNEEKTELIEKKPENSQKFEEIQQNKKELIEKNPEKDIPESIVKNQENVEKKAEKTSNSPLFGFDMSSLITFAMSKFTTEMQAMESRITNKMNERLDALEKRLENLEKKSSS